MNKRIAIAAVLAALPMPALADAGPQSGAVQTAAIMPSSDQMGPTTSSNPQDFPTFDQRAPRGDRDGLGFSLTSGASWSSGDYGGGRKTDILTVPIAAALEYRGWRLTVNDPYMNIRSAGNVAAGIDGAPIVWNPGGRGPRHTYSGMGDLTLGLAYTVPNLPNGWEVEVAGKAKLPTSSFGNGLSTGKHDYEVGGTVAKEGFITPFVTVNYRWFGDPAFINLRNGFEAQGGGSIQGGPGTFRLSYAWARSPSPLVHTSNEIVAAYALPVKRFTISAFGSVGLSNGAPDKGLGLIASARF